MNVRVLAPWGRCQGRPSRRGGGLGRTKVEDEVAEGHQRHGGWCARPAADVEIDSPGDEEEDAEDQEGPRQPLPAGEAVGGKDEAGAARDGGQGDGQEVLLRLLDEDVVYGVAGLRHVRLPRRESLLPPPGHRRVSVGERRVPAWQGRVQPRGSLLRPQIRQDAPVVKRESVYTVIVSIGSTGAAGLHLQKLTSRKNHVAAVP